MTSIEKRNYYAETANRETRENLVYAVSLITTKKTAIDCGCGAGADIAYLIKNGFSVFACHLTEKQPKRFLTQKINSRS